MVFSLVGSCYNLSMSGERNWSIYGVTIATLLMLVALGLAMWRVDPYQASQAQKGAFYAALGLALWGVITWLILGVRKLINQLIPAGELFQSSFFFALPVAVLLLVYLLFK